MSQVSSFELGMEISMAFQTLLRISRAVIIYIVIIVSIENWDYIDMLTPWIVFVLYSLSTNVSAFTEVMLPFIGLFGLLLNVFLRKYMGTDYIEIYALRITLLAPLLALSKTCFSKCIRQVYWTFRQVAEKNQVYQNFVTAKVIMFIISASLAVSAFYIVEKVYTPIHKIPCAFDNHVGIDAWKLEDTFPNGVYFISIPEITVIEYSFNDDCLCQVPDYSQAEIASWPLHTYFIKRYPGETVHLTCKAVLEPIEHNNVKYPVLLKESFEVRNSSRRKIHLSENKFENVTLHILSLVINDMKPSDFGLYRLILRTVSRSEMPYRVSSKATYSNVHVLDYHMCEFNVHRIKEYYEYAFVSVGSLLSFKLVFFRGNHSHNIATAHFVNGVPLGSMTDISSDCCLPSVKLYLGLLHEGNPDVPALKLSKGHINYHGYERWYVEAKVCVCPSIYGIHRFRFYREVYDPKRKSMTIEEFWHPQITVVYPKSSSLLGDTISEMEQNTIHKSMKDNDFSLFNGSAFQYLQTVRKNEFTEMIHLDARSIMWSLCFPLLILLVVVFYLFVLMDGIWTYICYKMGMLLNINPPNHGGNLANLGDVANVNEFVWGYYHYDIFVLYVEEDRDFVMYTLFPHFDEHRLCVFLSEEDPHAGPRMKNLILALTMSKKSIIVVSENFVNNKLYNNFFLPDIVLHRLYEGLINYGHIMLLVCKPCRIPELLATDRRIVTLDYTRNQRIIFRRKLYEWLACPVIQQGFGLYPIIHPDLQQLS